MAAWPATLPQKPLIEGFRGKFKNQVIRTQMETGPAKVRRRFTAAPTPMSLSFIMTDTQLQAFQSFYDTDLGGGALDFSFGAAAKVRFLDPPEYEWAGIEGTEDVWKVFCNMEILP